jgi:hypothetical protein
MVEFMIVPVKPFWIKNCLNWHKEMVKIGKMGRLRSQFGQVSAQKAFAEREKHSRARPDNQIGVNQSGPNLSGPTEIFLRGMPWVR